MTIILTDEAKEKILATIIGRVQEDFEEGLLEKYIENKGEEGNSINLYIDTMSEKVLEKYVEDGSNIDDVIDYLPEDLEIDGKEIEILENIVEQLSKELDKKLESLAEYVDESYDDSDPYDYRTYGFTMSDFI